MSRLIVVSNRVGDFRSGFQAGGLSVAVCAMLKASGGLWFGAREVDGESGDLSVEQQSADGASDVRVHLVPVGKALYHDYYLGFSNSVLWPVCHNRLDVARFDNSFYDAYCQINARFAEAIAPEIQPDDRIWVQDYHFILLGEELRKRGINNPIGFFLHIPFPPGEVFASISQHSELGRALTGYDLIGFQTMKDASSFLGYVQRQLGGRLTNDGRVRLDSGSFACGSFPVSIDTGDFARAAQSADGFPEKQQQLCHIIGVDRLDYSKGLLQRFEAYGKFLKDNPHRHGKVVFTQIAPPTRQSLEPYKDMEDELARLAGSINGTCGGLDWTPIRYIHRAYPRDRLAGLFRAAGVGLVTPIQDGMNLVAKEYVAAQDPQNPGVLVLSKFAGAAEELGEAVIVNPHDVDDMAQAIETALRMPLDERRQRHRAMFAHISHRDIHHWGRSFLAQMEIFARRRRNPLAMSGLIGASPPKRKAPSAPSVTTLRSAGDGRARGATTAPIERPS